MGCALSASIRSDPDSLADALLDAIVAARVPKGTLKVPVCPHARRLPSGRRGITRKMLRAIRRFYCARGALGMLMGDLIKKEGFEWSVCALTRSTGLSLIESLALTAEARGEVASALIGLATTFFSYSWTGTPLGDMLDAVERKLAEEMKTRNRGKGKGNHTTPMVMDKIWIQIYWIFFKNLSILKSFPFKNLKII
jgi:hypothetical protein